MSINAEDVFNPKDFESIKLIVYFANTTTGTAIKDPGKISLTEIGEKHLTLDLPSKSCNAKHNVTVDIKRFDKQQKKEIEIVKATGKVHSFQDVGDDRARVVIECVQFDEKSWADLLAFYSNRQQEIEAFFKAVKGY